eukprot:2036575-Amphidinium_carterae.1
MASTLHASLCKVDVNVTRPASERWNDDDDDDAEADPLSLPPFRADGDEERTNFSTMAPS